MSAFRDSFRNVNGGNVSGITELKVPKQDRIPSMKGSGPLKCTDEQVREMRRAYRDKTMTKNEIIIKYIKECGITKETVIGILHYQTRTRPCCDI